MTVVNLNKVRKARARATDKAVAKANRVKFGRTAAERKADETAVRKLDRTLDQSRREPDPD